LSQLDFLRGAALLSVLVLGFGGCGKTNDDPEPDAGSGGAAAGAGGTAVGGKATTAGGKSAGGATSVGGGTVSAGGAFTFGGSTSLGGTAGTAGEDAGGQVGLAGAGGSPEPTAGTGSGGVLGAAGADAGGQGGDGGVDPLAPPNLVFVTSKKYPVTKFVRASADAECNTLANAAGHSGKFVAWLSDQTMAARTRLGNASAWVNVDGSPFADSQQDLLENGQVFFPIRLDENGAPVTGRVATGSSRMGTLGSSCTNWTSTYGGTLITVGDPTAGSVLWTDDWTTSSTPAGCDQQYHLYCFQVDHSAAIYPTPTESRLAFVSQGIFNPGPTGRAAADALCAAEAAAAGFQATYVALVGTTTESPLSRLIDQGRAWVRPDGMTIANGTSELLQGILRTPFTQFANGEYRGGLRVLGASSLGEPLANDCDGWTNLQATGPVDFGIMGYTDERAFSLGADSCALTKRVICVER